MSRCSLKSKHIFFLSSTMFISRGGVEKMPRKFKRTLDFKWTDECVSFVECFTFTLSTQLNGFLFVLNKRMRALWAALCHPFKCLPFTNSDKSMTLSDIVQLTETENRLHISTSFLVISSMKLNDHCYAQTAQHTLFFVHNSQRMQSDCCYYSEINANCCVYCAAWYCAAHQYTYTFMSLFCIDHFFCSTFFLLSYLLCVALHYFALLYIALPCFI